MEKHSHDQEDDHRGWPARTESASWRLLDEGQIQSGAAPMRQSRSDDFGRSGTHGYYLHNHAPRTESQSDTESWVASTQRLPHTSEAHPPLPPQSHPSHSSHSSHSTSGSDPIKESPIEPPQPPPPTAAESPQIMDSILLEAVGCLMHQENCLIAQCPCREVKTRFKHIIPQTRVHIEQEAARVMEDLQSGNFDPTDRRQQMRLSLSSQNFSPEIHAHYHMTSRSHIRQTGTGMNHSKCVQHRRSKSIDLTPVMEQPERSRATTADVVIPDSAEELLCGSTFSLAVTPSYKTLRILSPSIPSAGPLASPVLLREISLSADNLPALCLNDCPMTTIPLMHLGNRPLGSNLPLSTNQQPTRQTEGATSDEGNASNNSFLSWQSGDTKSGEEKGDISDEKAQMIIEEAMEWSSLHQRNVVGVITGLMGVGKTTLLYHIFGLVPPETYTSTGVASQPFRGLLHHIVAFFAGTWKRFSREDMLKFLVALMMKKMTKENVCLLAQKLLVSIDPSPKESLSAPANTTQSQPQESYTSKKMVPLVQSVTATLNDLVLELIHMIDTGGQPELMEVMPSLIHNASFAMVLVDLRYGLSEQPQLDYHEDGIPYKRDFQSNYTGRDIILKLASTLRCKKSINKAFHILIIATHRDCVKSDVEARVKTLNSDVCSILLPEFENELLLCEAPDNVAFVLNLMNPDDNDLKSLSQICTEVRNSCLGVHFNTPTAFFVFEQDLIQFAESVNRYILSLEECKGVGAKLKMTDEMVEAALVLFHSQNTFLYFRHVLPNHVFIEPNVLFDIVNSIVRFSYKKLKGIPAKLVSLLKDGIITEELLNYDEISPHFKKGFYEIQDAIKLFCHTLTLAPLQPDTELVEVAPEKKEYLMMCLKSAIPKLELHRYIPKSSDTVPLVIKFSSGCVPLGCFGSTISCLLSRYKWGIAKKGVSPKCLAHNIASLHDPKLRVDVVLVDFTKYLEIHVDSNLKCRKSPAIICSKIRKKVLGAIEQVFEIMHLDMDLISASCAFTCPCPETLGENIAVFEECEGERYLCCECCKSVSSLNKEQLLWVSSDEPQIQSHQNQLPQSASSLQGMYHSQPFYQTQNQPAPIQPPYQQNAPTMVQPVYQQSETTLGPPTHQPTPYQQNQFEPPYGHIQPSPIQPPYQQNPPTMVQPVYQQSETTLGPPTHQPTPYQQNQFEPPYGHIQPSPIQPPYQQNPPTMVQPVYQQSETTLGPPTHQPTPYQQNQFEPPYGHIQPSPIQPPYQQNPPTMVQPVYQQSETTLGPPTHQPTPYQQNQFEPPYGHIQPSPIQPPYQQNAPTMVQPVYQVYQHMPVQPLHHPAVVQPPYDCEHNQHTPLYTKHPLPRLHISQIPTLPLLQRFPTAFGGVINIVERIGTKNHQLGIRLLNDDTGAITSIIEADHRHNMTRTTEAILQRWLEGTGRTPRSWPTLIAVLKEIDHNFLAQEIEVNTLH